jgi:hypothetical protein
VSRDPLVTFSQQVKNIINQEAAPRVRQAYLVFPYQGSAREVYIQIGDPSLGRGVTVRATLQPGIPAGTIIPAGTAVSAICRHGHYVVIGLNG